MKLSFVALGITAAFQLAIVAVSGSTALFADTVHNFSDALTAVPLWIAFTLARRSSSRRYPYGYGRAEDLAGLFIVAMIGLSAAIAGWESVRKLRDPVEIDAVGWVVVAAIVGFLGNEAVALYRMRVGRRIGSAALEADGLHARTDGLTSLAVLAGAIGSLAGFPLLDPIVGLVITGAILIVLRGTASTVFHRMMDGFDDRELSAIEGMAAEVPGVQKVTDARARWSGHRIIVELSVEVDRDMHAHAAHDIAGSVQTRLRSSDERITHVTVHIDPCDHDDSGMVDQIRN